MQQDAPLLKDAKVCGIVDWDKDCPGATLLHLHSFYNDIPNMVDLLHQGGCGVDDLSRNGYTPLLLAVEQANVAATALLLASNASPDVSEPEKCTTPLMLAVSRPTKEHKVIIGLLLKSGATLNAQNKNRRTALIKAVRKKQLDSVKILCEAGADVNMTDHHGYTAAFHASFSGNLGILEVLRTHGADFDRPSEGGEFLLITAIERDQPEVVKYLIERKASLEVTDYDGDTALHTAVWEKNTHVVHTLCEAGANINTPDHMGKTPLDNALFKKNTEITMTLLRFEAKLSSGSFEQTMLKEMRGDDEFKKTIRHFMMLEESHRASQNAHMNRMQAIADEMMCTICLDVVCYPSTVHPCQHSFCMKCLENAMEWTKKCPLCRGNVKKVVKIHMLANTSILLNGEPPAKRVRPG